jgi:hemin uptake protein HemP
MSETPDHLGMDPEETTVPRQASSSRKIAFVLPPRRVSSASLLQVQQRVWLNHLNNELVGGVTSVVDTNGANLPAA